MKKRHYDIYHIYSIVLCLIIVLGTLILPWVRVGGTGYTLPQFFAGIIKRGSIMKFFAAHVTEITIPEMVHARDGLGANLIMAVIGYSIHVIVVILYIYYLIRLFRGEGDDTLIAWIWFVGFGCFWGFYAGQGMFELEDRLHKYIIPLPGQILVIAAILLEFFGSRGMMEQGEKERQKKEYLAVMEAKNELLEQNYREILDVTQRSRMAFHDFKNDINILRQYAQNNEMEKIKQYLSEIGTPVFSLESYTWTGNEMIDLILNHKMKAAKERGISFQVKADPVGQIHLTDKEICSVFGNLLDNAVEACEKTEQRWIEVSIIRHKQILQIRVTNSAMEVPKKEGRRFLTWKQDTQMHGLGLQSVEMIVRKYDGDMQIEYDEKKFEVYVTFFGGQQSADCNCR